MRTLLGMQYGGNVPQQYPSNIPQQYPSNMPQQYPSNMPRQYPRQQIPPQQFQEGGGVSSGLAGLRRLGKKREARDVFGETQTEQVGKQKSGSFLGSVLGLGTGAGAAWLTPLLLSNPVTAAAALPYIVGGATGAGKWLGEYLGYGGEQDIDTDIMYGKEAGLEDIERAGEEYQSGMGQRAALSGIKAGLMAGFAPDGGMYGKIAGRGAPATTAATGAGDILPTFAEWSSSNPNLGYEVYSEAITKGFPMGGSQYNPFTLSKPPKLTYEEGGMINQQPQSLLSYLMR